MAFASTFDADPELPDQRTAFRVVACVLALALALHALRAWQVNSTQPSDFLIFYEASRDLHAGANPYAESPHHFPYIYPPLLAWGIAPLTALPLKGAVEVWVVLSFAAWLGMAAIAVKLARSEHGRRRMALVVLPSLIAYRFILRLNLQGQVDLVLWALVAFSAWALQAKRPRTAGGLLGLALVIKPLPVLFLAAMAKRREGTACATAIATAALLLVLPAVTVGPARATELLTQWTGGRITRDLTDVGFEVHASNQSLQAFCYRYLAARPTSPDGPWPAPLAALSAGQVNALWAGLVGAIALVSLAAISAEPVSRRRWGVEVALLVCATHLVSRRTMEYHLVSLVLVFALVIGVAQCPGFARGWRRGAWATVALVALLINFYAPPFVGKPASLALQARGFTTLALVLAWGYTSALLARWSSASVLSSSAGGGPGH